MTKPLCIYHGNCADGFGAAWAVWKKHPDWEFHPGVYQNDPPDVTGRDIVMVDFSYKRPVIDEMVKVARSILILDHHKSAEEDLSGLPPALPSWGDAVGASTVPGHPNIGVQFDMERSGAIIAWDYFHSPNVAPRLMYHIQDRDLWRFDLPGTRAIQANLFSYPYEFDIWDDLMNDCEDDAKLRTFIKAGEAIERKHHKDIAELVGVVTLWMNVGGYNVPMANLPYTLTSDAGHLLCKQHKTPFAGCYWDTPEGRVFSLRSLDDGMDVAEIAKEYGGGGHKHASGFRVEYTYLDQFEPLEA